MNWTSIIIDTRNSDVFAEIIVIEDKEEKVWMK